MSETRDERPISALTSAVVDWAVANGAGNIGDAPGLWSGETDEWKVEANGHREEIDGLPFAHFRLTHKKYLTFAFLSPFDGCIIGGYPEDELIAHFRAAIPKAEVSP